VEREAYAGMPSSETCLACHSQIWSEAKLLEPVRESAKSGEPLHWKRVTRIPHYVYFNHSIHIQKGVACISCHGDVATMPLLRKVRTFAMRDCLECHRKTEESRARARGVAWNAEASFLTRCNTCHR
jgi:predicted CxxxxCH...CXXCH cytochrome family protein